MRFLAGWLRITTYIVAFALVAALVGYSALAEMGMRVALGVNFALSSFVAAAGILEALLTVGLGSPALSNLRMLNTRRRVVLGVLSRVVRLVLAVTFVFAILSVIGLAEPLARLIEGILTAQIGYGSVQLSLGGVLAFVATVWASLKLGRLVTFVFDEEVVPRVRMAPGVSYAIATFARYLIIVFGFVIAIAMLGFQMDRLALLLSALGVGIGFGLQNVANNFVSGVIMLFERPIRVGDRVAARSGPRARGRVGRSRARLPLPGPWRELSRLRAAGLHRESPRLDGSAERPDGLHQPQAQGGRDRDFLPPARPASPKRRRRSGAHAAGRRRVTGPRADRESTTSRALPG